MNDILGLESAASIKATGGGVPGPPVPGSGLWGSVPLFPGLGGRAPAAAPRPLGSSRGALGAEGKGMSKGKEPGIGQG